MPYAQHPVRKPKPKRRRRKVKPLTWTMDRQIKYALHLYKTCDPEAAAAHVGMSAISAQRLRFDPVKGPIFQAMLDEVFIWVVARIEDMYLAEQAKKAAKRAAKLEAAKPEAQPKATPRANAAKRAPTYRTVTTRALSPPYPR